MGEFNTKPSSAFLSAVATLRALPLRERTDAYAEACADEMRELATRSFGKLKKSGTWEKLAGIPRKAHSDLPADDHGELREGKLLSFISQPYDLSLSDMRKIVRLCEEYGMDVHVDAQSWYYPGRTLRMTYRKRKKSS